MHQLKDLMSRDVKVISPDMTINEAARTMRDGDFGTLPVGEKRPHDRRDFGSGHCDPSRGLRQRARHESARNHVRRHLLTPGRHARTIHEARRSFRCIPSFPCFARGEDHRLRPRGYASNVAVELFSLQRGSG
jgi:CBS domain-containing protein